MTIDNKIVSKNEFKQIKVNKEDIVLLNIDKDITIKKTNEFLNILKSMGLEKVHINVLDNND
jgi:biopolymer transport protein ExbD